MRGPEIWAASSEEPENESSDAALPVSVQWCRWAADNHDCPSEEIVTALNRHLAPRTCIVGPHPTVADSAVMAMLASWGELDAAALWPHPHLRRWQRSTKHKQALAIPQTAAVITLDDPVLCEQHVREMLQRAEQSDGACALGLDTEWADRDGRTSAVLLQICDDSCVLLIRLPQCLPSESLRQLLSNGDQIYKAGVAVMGDAAMLHTEYGLTTTGCIDLRHPAAVSAKHLNHPYCSRSI